MAITYSGQDSKMCLVVFMYLSSVQYRFRMLLKVKSNYFIVRPKVEKSWPT